MLVEKLMIILHRQGRYYFSVLFSLYDAKGGDRMDINSIYSASPWISASSINTLSTKTDATSSITATSSAGASGGSSSTEEEEVTTKITVTPEGDMIMVFMRGDEVIRSIKIGSRGETLTTNAMSKEESTYVDNGTSDIGSIFSSSI